MKNITIRKSVREDLANKLPNLIEKAIVWLRTKHPNVSFDNIEYIFSSNYNRSRYFRNEIKEGKYLLPNVCISTRATLYLYNKKSLKLKKTAVYVGSDIQIMCALIHELTHHVQHEQKRTRSELETTKNEVLYLKENHLEIYNKIV